MLLPRTPTLGSTVTRRQEGNSSSQAAIISVVVIVILISLAVLSYIILKTLRNRHPRPRYIPTQYLKRKWEAWSPRGLTDSKRYSSRLQNNDSGPTLHANRASAHILPEIGFEQVAEQPEHGNVGASVDRHTSVRSVMTLPAYSRSVRENERVLGREGERDGIDVVLEQPETQDEEEVRREEEMESLYQIRIQRRREVAEREERRRQRREARQRGDLEALSRMRLESMQRAEERDVAGAAALMAEHQSRSRERRVSSVSYGDLGVARHDGTRIRGTSSESHRPLLNDAASVGGGTVRPWSTHSSLGVHHRDRSASSIMSASDEGSDFDIPPFGRSGSDFEIVAMNQGHSRDVSRGHTPLGQRSRASSNSTAGPPTLDTSLDLGIADRRPPGSEPPIYAGAGFEEAPPYTSPVRERASRPQAHQRQFSASGAPLLPEISRLPSIRIAEATPIEPQRRMEWPETTRESAGQR